MRASSPVSRGVIWCGCSRPGVSITVRFPGSSASSRTRSSVVPGRCEATGPTFTLSFPASRGRARVRLFPRARVRPPEAREMARRARGDFPQGRRRAVVEGAEGVDEGRLPGVLGANHPDLFGLREWRARAEAGSGGGGCGAKGPPKRSAGGVWRRGEGARGALRRASAPDRCLLRSSRVCARTDTPKPLGEPCGHGQQRGFCVVGKEGHDPAGWMTRLRRPGLSGGARSPRGRANRAVRLEHSNTRT